MTTTKPATLHSAHRSATCPICRATVIVWKREGLKASLLRALALASHVSAIHPATLDWYQEIKL